MCNTIAYHTHQSSSHSRFTNEEMTTESHSGITVSTGMQEMSSLNMPVQRLKVATLPLDVTCSGFVTHSGEILTTGNSHGKKPDRFSLNDEMDVEKVLGFKYATWNIRWVGRVRRTIRQKC